MAVLIFIFLPSTDKKKKNIDLVILKIYYDLKIIKTHSQYCPSLADVCNNY